MNIYSGPLADDRLGKCKDGLVGSRIPFSPAFHASHPILVSIRLLPTRAQCVNCAELGGYTQHATRRVYEAVAISHELTDGQLDSLVLQKQRRRGIGLPFTLARVLGSFRKNRPWLHNSGGVANVCSLPAIAAWRKSSLHCRMELTTLYQRPCFSFLATNSRTRTPLFRLH